MWLAIKPYHRYSSDDNQLSFEDWVPFGGWTQPYMKACAHRGPPNTDAPPQQYSQGGSLCGMAPTDFDWYAVQSLNSAVNTL